MSDTARPTLKQMRSEFRCFTNALRRFGHGRYWAFLAEADEDIVVVAAQRVHPKGEALEALVRSWEGKINEDPGGRS